jgi:guanylate kinase
MKKTGKLFIVSAPSGTGKTTLVQALCQQLGHSYRLERVVTYTTKQPRLGEKDGQDYHFLSKEAFEQKIESGFFMEWSSAYGHYYGSPASILAELPEGKSYFLVIDRAGAQTIRSLYNEAILIWLYTKNFEDLKKRLFSRNTETNFEISRRLMLAKQEILQENENSLYQYHVLNDTIENALSELKIIILKELESPEKNDIFLEKIKNL